MGRRRRQGGQKFWYKEELPNFLTLASGLRLDWLDVGWACLSSCNFGQVNTEREKEKSRIPNLAACALPFQFKGREEGDTISRWHEPFL